MAKILLVIAPERFHDDELFHTRKELERARHTVLLASTTCGLCTGSLGGSAEAELALDAVDPQQYDALAFIGGRGCAVYFQDPRAHALAREMFQAGKVVAAICLAPVILAEAGILNGKKATVSGAKASVLESRSATFIDFHGPGVTVDGTIVTGNGPKAARQFGQQINAVLNSQI